MKRLFIFTTILLFLSGCSVVNINKQSIDEVVGSILSTETDLRTVSMDGYSYFLPQGVSLKTNIKENSILFYNHKKMFLYVDMVSYYNKVQNDFVSDDSVYYSKSLNYKDKFGYLHITEHDTKYFVEFMYNYSKIEAYVEKEELNKTLSVMAYILNSVDYNDILLDSMIGPDSYNSTEEQFNIFRPNSNDSTYLDYIEKYDKGRTTGKDEDTLELDVVE